MTTSLAIVILIAAVAIGAFLVGQATGRRAGRDDLTDIFTRPPMMPRPQLPRNNDELETEVRALLAEGNKIEAIKLVRAATGLGLKEAKDFVEGL